MTIFLIINTNNNNNYFHLDSRKIVLWMTSQYNRVRFIWIIFFDSLHNDSLPHIIFGFCLNGHDRPLLSSSRHKWSWILDLGYLPICRGIFLKHSRFTNGECQYVEEFKRGFQYVEEYKSSTYWLVFLDLLANHGIYQYVEEY